MTPYQKTIRIEIPVQISFSIDKGQKGTRNQPNYEPSIEDVTFDDKQIIEAVNNEVYGEESTVVDDLWDDVNNPGVLPF